MDVLIEIVAGFLIVVLAIAFFVTSIWWRIMKDSEPIRLDDPLQLPKPILDRLNRISATMIAAVSSVEDLLYDSEFYSIARDVESFIRERQVRAYHCTRERHAGFFESRGLRPLSAKKHVEEFLDYAHNTLQLAEPLISKFRAIFAAEIIDDTGDREICFHMSPYSLVHDETVDVFFTWYGGEVLFRSVEKDADCLDVLSKIGNPVVVEIAAPAPDFQHLDLELAKLILSHYAKTINPKLAICEPCWGILSRPVTPDGIISVHSKESFMSNHCSSDSEAHCG